MGIAADFLHANGVRSFRSNWFVHAVTALVLMVGVGLVHHETVASIAHTWSNTETYTHGWLILPFAAWLVWRERGYLRPMQPESWWPGLAVFALLELIWITGAIGGVLGPQHAALVAMIPAAVLLVLGPRVARAIAFPLGFLVFAIPWGAGLVPVLQDVTAHMAVGLLDLIGQSYYWEGRFISTPAGDFEVAEACGGIRYLIASLALGTLYAYLTYRSLLRRSLFVLACIVAPILANGVRAWGIIMLATLSDMKIAVGVDHLLYGWLFFGLVMFLLFWIGSFWREPAREAPAEPANAGTHGTGERPEPLFTGTLPMACAALAAVAIVFSGSAVPAWSARLQPVPDTGIALPAPASGWTGHPVEPAGWYIGFEGADAIRAQEYRSHAGGEPVYLLVIHYRQETDNAELVRFYNRLHGDTWNWLGAGQHELVSGGDGRPVRELRLLGNDARRVLWTWYEIGGWQTSSAVLAKGFALLKRLTGQAGDATLVAVASGYDLEPADARARLDAFLADHPGVIEAKGLIEER